MPLLVESPYLGLRPYSEADARFFFGRERDQEGAVASLYASRLTLLYGPSGVGKSSLLRAGVVPELQRRVVASELDGEAPDVAVIYFNKWQGDPVPAFRQAAVDYIGGRLAAGGRDELLAPPTLAGIARNIAEALKSDLFIIFDQFEEFFLYHPADELKRFDHDFANLVTRPGTPVSVLLSLRDDSLSKLDRFRPLIPNLFASYVRVHPLTAAQARDAIIGPLAEYNSLSYDGRRYPGAFTIETALVNEVVRAVQTGRVTIDDRGVGGGADSGTGIEAPYLQVVMSALWSDAVTRGSTVLTRDSLVELRGAEAIVRTHLDTTLSTLTDGERDLCAELFGYLVTPSGTKIAYEVEHLAHLARQDVRSVESLLNTLVDEPQRILTTIVPVAKGNPVRYEIRHDSLADAMLEWRRRHVADRDKEAQERARADETERQEEELRRSRQREAAERARAELEARRVTHERRLKRLSLVLAAVTAAFFLAAVFAARYAVGQRDSAQAARNEALRLGQELQNVGDQLGRKGLDESERRRLLDELEASKARLATLTAATPVAQSNGTADYKEKLFNVTGENERLKNENAIHRADIERLTEEKAALTTENEQLKRAPEKPQAPTPVNAIDPTSDPLSGNPPPSELALPAVRDSSKAHALANEAWQRLAGEGRQVVRGKSTREDRQAARAIAQQAVDADPEHPNPHHVLGNIFLEEGDGESAEREFRLAITLLGSGSGPRLEGGTTTFKVGLAESLVRQKQWSAALDLYTEIATLLPNDLYASRYISRGFVRRSRADMLVKVGRLDEAIAEYRAVLKDLPNSATTRRGLAEALSEQAFQQKRPMREAINEYQQAVKLAPKDAAAHHGLGLALQRDKKRSQAIAEFELAVNLAPDNATAKFDLAAALYDARQPRTEQVLRDYLASVDSRAPDQQERIRRAEEMLEKISSSRK